MGNSTCPSEYKPIDPVPFFTHGSLNFKAHDVGWIICGFFTLIASVSSFWLIWKHLTYYTCPQQQRHIIRMLFMVPIYAIVSLLSYVFYHQAIYYQTIRDCYEAVVITSFFYLLLQYVGDTPAEQHEVFRMVKLKKWFWPLGFWKYRPDGLHFLWLMKICILQYAIVRPVGTLVAVGLQYFGLYCLESWEPWFGHIYITIAISISVTVAMYCIIQFYMPIQEELKPYSPVLKFLAVKSVVFLTFWQDSFLSILVYFGAIKESQYMTAADIQVGINALLETFEMCIFGFLHIKAFTYIVYRPKDRQRTTRKLKALLDVLDYRDWYYQMRQSSRYVAAKTKGRDFSIVEDIRREKYSHLEKALGRDRWSHLQTEWSAGKENIPTFWKPGCEPGEDDTSTNLDSDTEKTASSRVVEVKKSRSHNASSMRAEDDTESRKPRGNLAMRPDYDPENEDEDGPIDEMSDHQSLLQSNKASRLLPTLPRVEIDSIRSPSLRMERHPELSQYHRTELEEELDEKEDDYNRAVGVPEDIFIPRKGGRARKEGSLGLGAFWRQFRQRISGSQAEPVGEQEEDEVAEEDEFLPPVSSLEESKSDASQSAIRSRDSPLTQIIRNHGQEIRMPIDNHSAKIGQTTIGRTDAIASAIQRQKSDRAYITSMPLSNQEPRSIADAYLPDAQKLDPPPVQNVPLRAPVARKPVGDIESVAPSISIWSSSAQDHNKAKSITTTSEPVKLTENALKAAGLAPTSTVVQSNLGVEKSTVSLSTAELQKQLMAKEQKRSALTAKGPKGKRISVVLPGALSPEGLPAVEPVQAQATPSVSDIPASLRPGSQLPTPVVKRDSRLRFAEIRQPMPDPKDDPEADVPKVNGWVVAGGKSLKQIREMEEETKRKREEEERRQKEESRRLAFEQQQMQRHQHPQPILNTTTNRPRAYSRDGNLPQNQSSNTPSSSRTRRTSAPAVPETRSSLSKSNKNEKANIPTPLPAPSQLSGLDVHNVLFGGAEASIGQRQSHVQYPNRQRHQSQPSQTLSQIQVGSIVSRREVFNAMAPAAPVPMPQYSHHAVRPIPPSNFVRPPMMRPIRQQSNPSTNRTPPAWPVPPPSNAVGSRNISFQQQGRGYAPRPHPAQPQRSFSATQTSYDPYTGEPRLSAHQGYPMQRPPSRHSLPQQQSQRQSYNRNERGARGETREGFHFDYID
ncbi:hypothetical protein L7F22_068172 [Adiantum nelumboides]|nr:hypothetical protein [Adiantum nelumboides]